MSLAILQEVELLRDLPPDTLRALAAALTPRAVAAGAAVIRQGEPGDSFYILVEGEATVSRRRPDGEEMLLAILRPGDYFGEASLLRQSPRVATVRALTDLRLLRLGAAEFYRLLAGQIPEQTADAIRAREDLARCDLVAHLGPRELELVRAHLRTERHPAGTTILRQGEPGDCFYILRQGRCAVLLRDDAGVERQVRSLEPGDYFGEIALIQHGPRTATVRAVDDVVVWALDQRDFDDLLRRYFDLGGTLARTARQRAAAYRAAARPVAAAADRSAPERGGDQVAPGHDRGGRDPEQR
jgi:CRP-like cAMP-binding protein